MKKYIPVLKKFALFSGMKENEIEKLLLYLKPNEKSYSKDETVFHMGEKISKMGCLLVGQVLIQREDHWGNLSILSEISAGEIFGEAYAVSESTPITFNVIASEECTVLFLDCSCITDICPSSCQSHNMLIRNFISLLSSKNRFLTRKIRFMSERSLRDKLVSYLSEQSLNAGSATFDIPLNRQQLADYLSVDRSAMSNELSKMRKDGLLEFKKNHFTLL